MTSSRTTLRNLKNRDEYLASFDPLQPTYFEHLVAEVFAHIFHLPFFTRADDDPNVPYRLTWQGSLNPASGAPQGVPDAIGYCYDFYLVIEATLKTGSKQGTQEFPLCIRHCEDFCSQTGARQKDVYSLLICPDLHTDTYRLVKNNREHEVIPITVSDLARILETSILAFTIRHIQLRNLFHDISLCVRSSSSLRHFSLSVGNSIADWQRRVLKSEETAFIGLKSYETMIGIGRTHIGMSEILEKLQKHRIVLQYLKIIGDKIRSDIIETSLVQHGLAFQLKPTYDGESLFQPIPPADFEGSRLRLINAVSKIK